MGYARVLAPLAVAGLALSLGACAPKITPAPIASPAMAPAAIVSLGIPSSVPGFAASRPAYEAFHRACPRLARIEDRSGLTRPDDWAAACADTQSPPEIFFDRHFTAVRIGDGQGLATGYFEPEISASMTKLPGSAAVLRKPADLVDVDLGAFAADLKGRIIRGRFNGKAFIPYFDRTQIENGALAGRDLELAWAADPIELFFLQIQGSGRLTFPDGTIQRIGYAGQNGHAYVAIGRLLRERGILEKAGMAEIVAWLRANPGEGTALMRENPSYVFFRKLPETIDGPVGALGVPLIPEANAAIDRTMAPLGAPLFVRLPIEGEMARHLLIAADVGGAIKGANRLDIFWGHGPRAQRIAGSLAAPAEVVTLLPHPAARRLAAAQP